MKNVIYKITIIFLCFIIVLQSYFMIFTNEKVVTEEEVINKYVKLGDFFHENGVIDKAILHYKKALTYGDKRDKVQYEWDNEIVFKLMLALYHNDYYGVERKEIDVKLPTFNFTNLYMIDRPSDCNCFVCPFLNTTDYIDTFSVVLAIKDYENIEQIYNAFEVQIRSERMYEYRMWYEQFTYISPMNISLADYDLFYCVLDNVDYNRNYIENPNVDTYVYLKYYSPIDFNAVWYGDDFNGDGRMESFYVYHNRYNDTWWNIESLDFDGVCYLNRDIT